MTDPLISIVIVNYNGAGVLDPCLRSVMQHAVRPVEVILVDNASTDGSADAAEKAFPGIMLVRNDRNRGFAEANNQGVAAARGRYVVLLNSDTVVTAGWLDGLLAALDDPACGVVTSRVVTDGVPDEMYTMNGTINYLGYNIMRHFRDLSLVFFAGGASLMFRREEVGEPFPAEYFLYHEDVYLSWRMRLKGKQVRMAQSSRVGHRGSASTKREPGRVITFYQERNRLLNSLIFYEAGTLVALAPLFLLDVAAKLLLSIVGGRKSAAGILSAYAWVVTHAGLVRARRSAMQRERKVPDREILLLMSSRIVEGNSLFAGAVNGSVDLYARVTGLRP